jgi:hypothetical protein
MTDTAPFDLLMLVVVPAAIALGIYVGVRRYRELGRIARDALTGRNEQALAAVRAEVARPPVRVRLFFRILGFIVGPLVLLAGLLFIGMSLSSLIESGLRAWWQNNQGFVLAGVLCMPVGVLITRAAITGQGRYLR